MLQNEASKSEEGVPRTSNSIQVQISTLYFVKVFKFKNPQSLRSKGLKLAYGHKNTFLFFYYERRKMLLESLKHKCDLYLRIRPMYKGDRLMID